VEIAKLSLWLRTAQKGRKLNTLSNNIKCGNSLIDNPEIAGEKAFNWQKEFPGIFHKKKKKAWHVTTATHNSRYSQRMFDNHVKKGNPVWLTDKEEIIVTETIAEIIEKDKLNMLAYNICGDHAHMIIVCTENELPKIVQKIKAMSARACNIAMGRTIPVSAEREHAPRKETAADAGTQEHAPAHLAAHAEKKGEHAPLRGMTQFHLWAEKFDGKEITSNEQLENTITYILNNRKKHQLPENEKLQKLIGEMTCARQHAFRTEYTGGFDVVIGNPPYVQLQTMGEMSDKLKRCGYETFDKGADLYCLFTERGYKLLKKGGMQSYIMPNKWMLVAYGKPLRKFLSKTGLRQILNFGDIQFFEKATTYVCIFVTSKSCINRGACSVVSMNRKTYHGDFLSEVKTNSYEYPSSRFGENEWSIQPYGHFTVLEKMKQNGIELKELEISINYGIKTGYNNAFYIDDKTRKKLIAADAKSAEIIKPMVRRRDITAYGITGFEYLIGTFPSLKLDIENYPAIKQHLLSFGYDRLKQTGEKGSRKKTSGQWFETQDSIAYYKEFDKPKIMYPNMTSQFPFLYDETGLLSNDKSFILTANDDSVSLPFLTAFFNSSLAKLWIWYNCPELQGGTREIRKVYFEHFPVPRATNEQTGLLAQLATKRTHQTRQLQTTVNEFKKFLKAKTEIDKLSSKLENWYELEFKEFLKALKKAKIKLSLSKEAEWMNYFNEQKEKAQTIQSEIKKTDREIDRMVYELYNLTEEEIKIFEESTK
ncbi:MAG: Eco57I restriction-modification methylase domain-containing protein, partial [Mariniphaga sp.]